MEKVKTVKFYVELKKQHNIQEYPQYIFKLAATLENGKQS